LARSRDGSAISIDQGRSAIQADLAIVPLRGKTFRMRRICGHFDALGGMVQKESFT
jgi:hypothetical protein